MWVCHLAGKLVEALRERQPGLQISCEDILCVQIAGLCHDLGHGPFSHLYDGMFIPRVPKRKRKDEGEGEDESKGETWKHEDASLAMFDHLVEVNDLEPVMKKHRLELPKDLDFIKELIAGPQGDGAAQGQREPSEQHKSQEPSEQHKSQWLYKGRPEDKSFLYEIVANERNGIDVDKWDYFARDCHHLGIQNSFDYHRFLKFARVCEVKGKKQICTRDKEVHNLYGMFHTRMCLHRSAYKHPVGYIIEHMITEAFLEADEHMEFQGSRKKHSLSEAKDDMVAYTKLTDSVFEQILYSSDKKLDKAKEILNNIVCRRLYKYLGQIPAEKPIDVNQACAEVGAESAEAPAQEESTGLFGKEEIAKLEKEWARFVSQNSILKPEDFVVKVVTIDYGKKNNDPINNVRFYSKDNPTKAFPIPKDQVSSFLPEKFAEQMIRFYYKKTDDSSLEAAKEQFEKLCKNKKSILSEKQSRENISGKKNDQGCSSSASQPEGKRAEKEPSK